MNTRRRNLDAEERRDRIAELSAQGMSARMIADLLGVTTRTVVRARVARGCAGKRAPFLTEDELRTAKLLLEDGATYSEVARTIGRSRFTIQNRFPGFECDAQHRTELAVLSRQMRQLSTTPKK